MTIRKHSKGFTLMELLVAMTTFSIVMGGVYAAFNDAARFWRESENDIDVFQQARVTVSVLERELRNVHQPAGFLFYGKGSGRKERRRDSIEFYTVSAPLAGDQQQVPQIMKVAYYLQRSRGRQRGYDLCRKEWIVRGPLPRKKDFFQSEEPNDRLVDFERSRSVVLAEHVESMEFVHFWPRKEDEQQWFHDCTRGTGPPNMIQIKLIITDENLRSGNKAFRTTVLLPGTPGSGPKLESL